MEIRTLNPNEIDVRVQSTKKTTSKVGCILLLYKDARVDQKILDETFGAMYWQRDHKELKGNIYCGIGIYDIETKQWVYKWDCGSESNTEKEKGEASDSFKRAAFNWGIGRELYTSPFVWVDLKDDEYSESNGKTSIKSSVKFSIKSISYNSDREIDSLEIIDNKSTSRFKMGKLPEESKPTSIQLKALAGLAKIKGVDLQAKSEELTHKKASKDWTLSDYLLISRTLDKMPDVA